MSLLVVEEKTMSSEGFQHWLVTGRASGHITRHQFPHGIITHPPLLSPPTVPFSCHRRTCGMVSNRIWCVLVCHERMLKS